MRVPHNLQARRRAGPFMALVAQVIRQEPHARAKHVFWIVDNGSSHRGKAAADRLLAAFPNAVLVHTPVHASWLNQMEIFFSVVHAAARHRARPSTDQAASEVLLH